MLSAIIRVAGRGSISQKRDGTALYSVSLLLTGLVTLWLLTGFATAMFSSNGTPNSQAWVFYALVPTIIALGVTWAATNYVVRRVEQGGGDAVILDEC